MTHTIDLKRLRRWLRSDEWTYFVLPDLTFVALLAVLVWGLR